MRRVTLERIGKKRYRLPWAFDEGPEIEHVRSDKFGEMPASESLSQFARVLEHVFESGEGVLGWRGQSDAGWDLDSSAVRRQKSRLQEFDHVGTNREVLTADYEQKLLNEARGYGHGFRGAEGFRTWSCFRCCSTTARRRGYSILRGTHSSRCGSRRAQSPRATD